MDTFQDHLVLPNGMNMYGHQVIISYMTDEFFSIDIF